jgi:predicted GIY-YIG superfamily endonuclease
MSKPSERVALYRFFDADGVLLYVGITSDIEQRWSRHANDRKSWWPHVAKKTVEWLDNRWEASQAEARAVRDEGPMHNIQRPRMKRRPEVPYSDNPDSIINSDGSAYVNPAWEAMLRNSQQLPKGRRYPKRWGVALQS